MNDPSKRLAGKVAFITGGGSGIGASSARLLAQEGAKVCVLDLRADRLTKIAGLIEQEGGEVMTWEADITDPQGVQAGMQETVNRFGKLDIVFANAGINGVLTTIEHMELEDWSQTVNVNLRGTFLTLKYAIPHMKRDGGSIIITSSINGNRVFSNFGFSAYSTTKAAQAAFMKMAALELSTYRIRVNCVCPGAIDTQIEESTERLPEVEEVRIPVEFPEGDQPLRRSAGKPNQVAQLVLFLASDDSSHITGTKIYIDGAESLIRG